MTDLDGAERNVWKLRQETRRVIEEGRPHFVRWLHAPWDVHAYVNLFVETRRISPYLLGHIDSVLYPALIFAIAWRFW